MRTPSALLKIRGDESRAPKKPITFEQMLRKNPIRLNRVLWSGRRDSDPRYLPWQGSALPLSHSRIENYAIFKYDMVRIKGLEPPRRRH